MKSVLGVLSLALVAVSSPAFANSSNINCDIYYSGPRQTGPGTRVDVLDPKVGGKWMKVPEGLSAGGDLLSVEKYLGYTVNLMQFDGDTMVEVIIHDEKSGVTQDLRLSWAQEGQGLTKFISLRMGKAYDDQFELYCSRN